MPLKEQLKNFAKKVVEIKPTPDTLRAALRHRKPLALKFVDDGIVPNNARRPLLVYRGVIRFPVKGFDSAVVMDSLFEANRWGRSWRDTVYDFVHYHSSVHEVLGVARGSAVIEFGGIRGRKLRMKAGDIAILPAGTGHRLIESSRNFLVVGAYPAEGKYDECTDTRDRVKALGRIARTPKPEADPVFGRNGPLLRLWR